MNKEIGCIDHILQGIKTIESRRYVMKRAPRNQIQAGDALYFKDSGGMIRAKADVDKVLQFADLDMKTIKNILDQYGKAIHIQDRNYGERGQKKKYCILVFLKNPIAITPFQIDKTGFGNATARLVVGDIEKYRHNHIQ